MLLINKGLFIILFTVLAVLIAVLGTEWYFIMEGADSYSHSDSVFLGEQIIFSVVLLELLMIIAFAYIMNRSANIIKQLDKLADIAKYSNLSISEKLHNMGIIGRKIELIMHHENQLSRMKSVRISSLFALSEFLTDNITMSIAVTDFNGKIVFVSKKCLEVLKKSKNDLIGRHISSIISPVNVNDIIINMEETRAFLKYGKENLSDDSLYKGDTVCQPIINSDNEISDIIFFFEGAGITETLSVSSEHIKTEKSRKGIFNRFRN